MNDTLSRIKRVQSELHRWRLIAIGTTLFAMVVIVCGSSRQSPRSMDLEELTISDKNGRVRMKLGISETGPIVALVDTEGRPRLALSLVNERPTVACYDMNMNSTVKMTISDDDPEIVFTDSHRVERLVLRVSDTVATTEIIGPGDTTAAKTIATSKSIQHSIKSANKTQALLEATNNDVVFRVTDSTGMTRIMVNTARDAKNK